MSGDERASKRGPEKLDATERRVHTVSVRLNAAELTHLDAQRGSRMRGEWMRMAALDVVTPEPPSIPAINKEAWASLAKVAGNINKYQAAIEAGTAHGYPPELLSALRDEVQGLRAALTGANLKAAQPKAEDDQEFEGHV